MSPLATAELVDRIPSPGKGTMVIVSPIFHGTGLATYLVGGSVGNKMVTTRRFKPEATLRLIADHRADMLVAVPTMLHRIVALAPDVIAKYDTSSLKVISLSPGRRCHLSCRTASRTLSAMCCTTSTRQPSAGSPP